MPALPRAVYDAADRLGVVVYYAGRDAINERNRERRVGSLRRFCGWYWFVKGRRASFALPERGPFRSEGAAFADAITTLEEHAADDERVARILRRNALMPAEAAGHA